ncbi:MAG TPA: SCP2 sterol-binding domain-containing protein [Anaerolineales bacterium]|nr:SCP2 sterol-binding domain-containing protein [Anaerolineales bacterium]
MPAVFPSADWLNLLEDKLNNDSHYNEVAKKWEGDLLIDIQPAGTLTQRLLLYFDLWHGKCRGVEYNPDPAKYAKPTYILRTTYDDVTSLLRGKLDPISALMVNKLKLDGNLAYMMRNVPVVLDFMRCCREITTDIL